MEEEPNFYASSKNVRNPGMAPVDIPNVQFFYRCLEQVVELEIQLQDMKTAGRSMTHTSIWQLRKIDFHKLNKE